MKKGRNFCLHLHLNLIFPVPAQLQLALVDIPFVQFFIWDYYNKADQEGGKSINLGYLIFFFVREFCDILFSQLMLVYPSIVPIRTIL